jgi:hypothetical protein
MSVVRFSLAFSSSCDTFGGAVALLSRLSVTGGVHVSVCSYTGVARVSGTLASEVVPAWNIIKAFAFKELLGEGYDEDYVFVADLRVSESRYHSLQTVLSTINV